MIKMKRCTAYKDTIFYTPKETEQAIDDILSCYGDDEDFTRADAENMFYHENDYISCRDIAFFTDNNIDINKPVIINGSLGLWDGTKKIYPTEADTLEQAIQKCYGDGDYMQVDYDKTHVYITVAHHDGTNNFVITQNKKFRKQEAI